MDGGGLRRVFTVATNTYRETVRERVLYNLVFFAVLMTLSGLLLRQLSIRQEVKIVKDVGLGAMEVFGTLIAVFIGVGLVSKEIERRSLYPLLAKPLGRGEFLLGKYLGLCFTLLVNLAVMTAGLYATLWWTARALDPRPLVAVYGIALQLLLVVAFALLFSTLTSPLLAAVCTLALVVAGRFSDVLRNMREVLPATPGWLVQALYYAVPNYRDFDFKERVVYGDPVALADLGWASLYAAVYTTLALGLALQVFRRRDLQ
jgi:ABC-type transport system involved in multi-copper enzyme maturation permease subunit